MRKLFAVLMMAAIGWTGWYLFFKPYDFRINFSSKAIPGTVDQTIKSWERSLDNSDPIGWEHNTFEHTVNNGDKNFHFLWVIQQEHDTATRVSVFIKEPANRFMNKLKVPFSRTSIERISEHIVRDFIKFLNKHLKRIQVTVEGVSQVAGGHCVCVPLETSQLDKALGMMRTYNSLSYFVSSNNIEREGVPLIEIMDWDQQKDSLIYNFCYPVSKSDSLPQDSTFFYKDIPTQKALKAVYNGNYITSDRAWYALKSYAEEHELEVTGRPLEFFYNNPNFGGDELKWKAEVFLPIK